MVLEGIVFRESLANGTVLLRRILSLVLKGESTIIVKFFQSLSRWQSVTYHSGQEYIRLKAGNDPKYTVHVLHGDVWC